MIRVPLVVKAKPRRFDVGGGSVVVTPVVRLICTLVVGADRRGFDAWVDTGAPISSFPQRTWRRFAHEIEWLGDPAGPPLAATIGGVGYPFRLGRVPVAVVSADMRAVLPAVPVTAMFVFDVDKLPAPLVGLTDSVLAGRRLVVEPDLVSARLEAA